MFKLGERFKEHKETIFEMNGTGILLKMYSALVKKNDLKNTEDHIPVWNLVGAVSEVGTKFSWPSVRQSRVEPLDLSLYSFTGCLLQSLVPIFNFNLKDA